jgi:hypothetical protein
MRTDTIAASGVAAKIIPTFSEPFANTLDGGALREASPTHYVLTLPDHVLGSPGGTAFIDINDGGRTSLFSPHPHLDALSRTGDTHDFHSLLHFNPVEFGDVPANLWMTIDVGTATLGRHVETITLHSEHHLPGGGLAANPDVRLTVIETIVPALHSL